MRLFFHDIAPNFAQEFDQVIEQNIALYWSDLSPSLPLRDPSLLVQHLSILWSWMFV